MALRRGLMLLILVGLGSVPSRAEVWGAPSVEALTCLAEYVAVGRIASSWRAKEPYPLVYENYQFVPDTVIKGPRTPSVEFVIRLFKTDDTWTLRAGEKVIVFLSRATSRVVEPEYVGSLIPAWPMYPLSLIRFAEPDKYLFDRKEKVLKTGDEVEAVSKKTMVSLTKWQLTHHQLPVPITDIEVRGEAFSLLYHGSACYLMVPEFMAGDEAKPLR